MKVVFYAAWMSWIGVVSLFTIMNQDLLMESPKKIYSYILTVRSYILTIRSYIGWIMIGNENDKNDKIGRAEAIGIIINLIGIIITFLGLIVAIIGVIVATIGVIVATR